MGERPWKKGACSSLCALKQASLTLLDNGEGNLISGAENLVSPPSRMLFLQASAHIRDTAVCQFRKDFTPQNTPRAVFTGSPISLYMTPCRNDKAIFPGL